MLHDFMCQYQYKILTKNHFQIQKGTTKDCFPGILGSERIFLNSGKRNAQRLPGINLLILFRPGQNSGRFRFFYFF